MISRDGVSARVCVLDVTCLLTRRLRVKAIVRASEGYQGPFIARQEKAQVSPGIR